MIPTYRLSYPTVDRPDGYLATGIASWDDGSLTSRSIKYVYHNANGHISRGAPELPFEILVDMIVLAKQQGELSAPDIAKIKRAFP